MKKEVKTNNKVKDIRVNTQVTPDSIGRIEPTGPDEPANELEVEESTIIVNPDPDSMESRG